MKTSIKTIVAFATCLCAFSSCTQTTPDGGGSGQSTSGEILFGCKGIEVDTKSFVETKINALINNGFNVAAVMDKDNETMFNSHADYDDDVRSFKPYGGPYYYPESGTMSFYCIYPTSYAVTLDKGIASVSYTHNPDVDLVASSACGAERSIVPVLLSFKHILSQIMINCKGNDNNADFVLKSIKISCASEGKFLFAEDRWECGQYSDQICFAGENGKKLTSYYLSPCVDPVSLIPGDVSVNVVWTTYNKGTDTVIGEYDKTVKVNLQRGVRTSLNLTLPNDNANEILFNFSLQPWKTEGQNIFMEEPGRVVTTPASDSHLVETGNPMDLGLKGGSETFPYFFEVRIAGGEHDGKLAYTRNGRFHVNAAMVLADEKGNVLQPEIHVPEDAVRTCVSEDGHVEFFDGADKKISEADITLSTFLGSIETMAKIGERLYLPVSNRNLLGNASVKFERVPGHYGAPFVSQGFLNESDEGFHTQNGRLDVYIDGEGFFQVDIFGQLAYSKEGDFVLNDIGTVVDRNGCILQPEFAVPVETVKVVISPDGHIAAFDSDGMEIAGAEIPLYYFYDNSALQQKIMNGRHYYLPTGSSGDETEGFPGGAYSDVTTENGVLGTLVQGKYLIDTFKQEK